jgi:calcineurin-binding protein cabin-1
MLGSMTNVLQSSSDKTSPLVTKEENKFFESDILDKVWHILYDDCLYALGTCVEGELKHFHKARYKLAQGYYRRGEAGDLERAKEELSFCFKSSRSSFTVNMWEIDGTVRKGR